jgi:isoleucyl-tRNA synthetase
VLAWTTTPWTLPSNTALAINPAFRYAIVETVQRHNQARIVVLAAEGLLEQLFPTSEYANSTDDAKSAEASAALSSAKLTYRVLASIPGEQLVGLWYEQLLPWAQPAEDPEQAFRVIAGDFVSLEDGTGVVHIAPTFGADDARVAKLAGVPPLRVASSDGELTPLVDERGRFVRGLKDGYGLGGRFVKASYYEGNAERAASEASEAAGPADGSSAARPSLTVDEQIVVALKEHGQLFRAVKYQHSYPHCWRTDTPIIYYPLKSWFIRTTAFKDELIRLNQTIHWYPPSTGEGRFGEWLQKLSDWNLSRSRFWGVPLPIWVSADGSERKCIGSFAELKAEIQTAIELGVMSEDPFLGFEVGDLSEENYARIDVHRPFVDRVKLVSASGQVMTREADVIDVWFDSGAMPYAQAHYPFENLAAIDSGAAYPADFIAEGVDQTRGWFFTLHAISTMVFGTIAFKSVLSHGLLVDAEGRKMSKRLGNVIDPVKLLDSYGADPLRWYMITNSPAWQNLSFDPEGVAEVVRKFYRSLWSTYSFFATYANADNFTGTEPLVPVAERQLLDRWILSELQVTVQAASNNLDAFDGTRAYRAVQSFMVDSLSNWYVRLNRKRFWKAEMNSDKLAAFQTLRECLLSVSKLIAPVSPFHAERLYLDLTAYARELASVHATDYPQADPRLVDEALNAQMEATRRAASLTLSVRKDKGIKVRQPLAKLTVITDEQLAAALLPLAHLLVDEVNVKQVEIAPPTSDVIERSAQLNFREAGPRFGKQTKLVAERVKQLSASELVQLGQGKSLRLEIAGESFELGPELVKIQVRGKSGSEVVSDGRMTVVLDTTVSESLRREGFARELVSVIQRLRKSANFEVTTRITLEGVRHPALELALSLHGEYIRAETLCESVALVDQLEVEPVSVDEVTLQLRVSSSINLL